MLGECVVCKELTSNYKCTKCLGPYCSLSCYKQHQDSAECLEHLKEVVANSPTETDYIEEPTVHEPFKTEDTVPKEKLHQLGASEHLKNLLCNPHLRSLLTQIDTAPSAWKAMQVAMHEPLFLEFADECLAIVEPHVEDQ